MALIDQLIAKLDEAQRLAAQIKAGEKYTIKAGEHLQSYLDKGGDYLVEPNAVFEAQRFLFHKPIKLAGLAKLVATGGPALYVPPGANGIYVDDIECSAPGYGDVIQLGDNDKNTQGSLDKVPMNIGLTRVKVRGHNRKRALAISSTLTRIVDCEFTDVWDHSTARADSHPWAILNTPGDITILGGIHSGGSELGIIGGDTMKIPGVEPTNIYIGGTPDKNMLLFRPLSWMDDGIYRKVKCGPEMKTGHDVVWKYITVKGNWKLAQPDAFAFQFTPKSGGSITNVLVEDVIVEDSPSLCGITAYDESPAMNPVRTTGIRFNRVKATLDRVKFLGGGKVFQLQGGIGTLDVTDLEVSNPGGNSFMYTDKAKTQRIRVLNSKGNLAKYRFMLGGDMDGLNWRTYVDELEVTGNKFSEASALFEKNFPNNEYV